MERIGRFINSKGYNKFMIALLIFVLVLENYIMFTETIYQSWGKIIFRTVIILLNLFVLNHQFTMLKKK